MKSIHLTSTESLIFLIGLMVALVIIGVCTYQLGDAFLDSHCIYGTYYGDRPATVCQ